MARASGLRSWAGPEGNDPIDATTTGTGELIAAALDAGAPPDRRRRRRLGHHRRRSRAPCAPCPRRSGCAGIELVVACDVTHPLRRRRRGLRAAEGRHRRAGRAAAAPARAAGAGLPRGARRRRLRRSTAAAPPVAWPAGSPRSAPSSCRASTLVADELDLVDRIEGADLVVTGEGFVDEPVLRRQGRRRRGRAGGRTCRCPGAGGGRRRLRRGRRVNRANCHRRVRGSRCRRSCGPSSRNGHGPIRSAAFSRRSRRSCASGRAHRASGRARPRRRAGCGRPRCRRAPVVG